ncbi:hypothetical protein ACEK06_05755 [Pseudomonas brenneri]|uniref:hypothetical protein n=1 Tax=Pseudomonas brenneri TaxID=129817 RepID=UPI00357152E4
MIRALEFNLKSVSRRLKIPNALHRAGMCAAQIELIGVVFSNLFNIGLLASGLNRAVISSAACADELNNSAAPIAPICVINVLMRFIV